MRVNSYSLSSFVTRYRYLLVTFRFLNILMMVLVCWLSGVGFQLLTDCPILLAVVAVLIPGSQVLVCAGFVADFGYRLSGVGWLIKKENADEQNLYGYKCIVIILSFD
jgi:hypothetical protein